MILPLITSLRGFIQPPIPSPGRLGRSFVVHRRRFSTLPAAMEENQKVEAEVEKEEQPSCGKKVYAHYNHTLPSKYRRWTARESFQFMHDRPWQEVRDLYSNLVEGRSSLSALFGNEEPDDIEVPKASVENVPETAFQEDRTGRWARKTFKILLSYHGPSFDGWQKQPDLNTVQGLIEKSLGKFVDDNKAKLLKEKHLPLEGCALVAGRTDKGVTALRQVCSFYTWREDVKPQDIEECINNAAPGKLKVVSVSEVSREFHPNFTAKWRRYFYIFPLVDGEDKEVEACGIKENMETFGCREEHPDAGNGFENHIVRQVSEDLVLCDGGDELGGLDTPKKFSVARVNLFLRQLEGKVLSYKMFARDTKASRNTGPPTECFMYHARARVSHLRVSDIQKGKKLMCVELVANRFLRKMVRVLVATAVREAAAGAEEEVLVRLMDSTCRRATAPPAPPDGLCLADVGYSDFEPKHCLIFD